MRQEDILNVFLGIFCFIHDVVLKTNPYPLVFYFNPLYILL